MFAPSSGLEDFEFELGISRNMFVDDLGKSLFLLVVSQCSEGGFSFDSMIDLRYLVDAYLGFDGLVSGF